MYQKWVKKEVKKGQRSTGVVNVKGKSLPVRRRLVRRDVHDTLGNSAVESILGSTRARVLIRSCERVS